MAAYPILPVPIDTIPIQEYNCNKAFMEIHLDERRYLEEDKQISKIWKKTNDHTMIIASNYKLFDDPDQCIDFITSYEWRKIFLTLTDKYSYLLELIHDLPQIVFIYIYSTSPSSVSFKIENYSKLRIIVQENSSDANKQFLEDIQLFRRDLMPMNIRQPIQRKTKLLIEEAFDVDEYLIIWLQNNELSSTTTTIDPLPLSNIINSLKIFFSVNQCIDYIKSSNDDVQIFFISSHSNNDILLKQVSDYSQIIAIYILHSQQELVESCSTSLSNPKIRGIYSRMENLAETLAKEYEYRLKSKQMSMTIFTRENNEKTVRDLTQENVRFLWFQLLIDILIRIPYNDQVKDEMLYACRKHYGIPCDDEDNMSMTNYSKTAKKDLIDFEKNYQSSEVVKFYTNDSFLYRLFNLALRRENIDLLFIFRFFLADLYKYLQKLYLEQFPHQLPHTVFRGQLMTNEEFNSLTNNIGHLISMNVFFSTTEDRSVAEMFSGFGADPTILSVLFEIDVNVIDSTVKRPFASISHISTKPDELEVLFSIGSMFRIESIEDRQSIEGYWYVKLKFIEDDSYIHELRQELEKEFCTTSDLTDIGSVLIVMGDYQRAERYFRLLLEYSPPNHPTTYRLYSCLGKIAHNQGDHRTSLDYHEKALEYLKQPTSISNTQMNIGQVYSDIASSYHRLGQLDVAMKYLIMAINIQTSPKLLAHTYNQIALIYREKHLNHLALEYFLKALHIDEQILQMNPYQPALATTYNNIGEIYSQLDENENALKYLQYALDIRLKGTLSTHTDLAATYNNLGVVYLKQNQQEKALEVFEKALKIDTQALGHNHESLALTHNNISAVYRYMNDLVRALYHTETALRILLHSQAGENHVDIGTIQFNIGALQFTLGNYTKALKITQKALQNHLKILPENHERLAHTYLLLSVICRQQQQENNSTALEYMKKAVEIARISILPHNALLFEQFQSQLDFLQNAQFNDRRNRFEQIHLKNLHSPENLDLQDCMLSNYCDELIQISSDDILHRLQLLINIGAIYSKKENLSMAMKYFNEAMELYLQIQTSNRYLPQQFEPIMIEISYGIGRVYYRQKNWTISLNHFEKSLELALKYAKESSQIAEIYHSIGLSYKHKWDISMAIYYHELAISTAKKELSDDHPRIQIYEYNLRQLLSLI